jgi:hypothetical protein
MKVVKNVGGGIPKHEKIVPLILKLAIPKTQEQITQDNVFQRIILIQN